MTRRRTRATASSSQTAVGSARQGVKRRWRDYQSEAGNRPVRKFLDSLDEHDSASILAAMADVRNHGVEVARHISGDIYEVRADGRNAIYRVLFAQEGKRKNILLSLEGFKKKTQKTPQGQIDLAKRRLRDWRQRGNKA